LSCEFDKLVKDFVSMEFDVTGSGSTNMFVFEVDHYCNVYSSSMADSAKRLQVPLLCIQSVPIKAMNYMR